MAYADMKRDLATARRELTLAKKDAPEPSEEQIARHVKAATVTLERQHNEHITNLEDAIAFYMRTMTKAGKHLGKAAQELGVEIDVPTTRSKGLDANGGRTSGAGREHGRDSTALRAPQEHPATARRDRTPDRGGPTLPSANGAEPLEGIRKGARRILKELARRHPLNWTKSQVAQLVGMTASGGTFGAYVGDLRRAGLIAIEGKEVSVTEAGLDAAGEVEPAPASHEEVMAMWREKMRAGEFKLLERIAEAGEDGIEKQDLALEVEMTMTGGTFGAYIGTLNRNNLIEKRGSLLVPSPMLWPEYAT